MCTSLSKGQKKVYWKYLIKLEKSTDTNAYITEQALIDHFKNILQDEKEKIHTMNKSAIGDLDYKITTEELHTASKILKNGKSPGMDNVLNEMTRPFITTYPDVILKLFNNILHTNSISPEWLISLINTIYKKGVKDDPNNYRGISVMSNIGKLFFLQFSITDLLRSHNVMYQSLTPSINNQGIHLFLTYHSINIQSKIEEEIINMVNMHTYNIISWLT